MKMAESVEINRPAEAVFAYLSDVRNDANWQQTVVEARVTSEGPMDVGSTGSHRVRFMGMTDDYGWRVHEFDPPNRASWTFVSGPMSGQGGYVLEGTGESTKMTWTGDVQPHGFRRLLAPVMGPMFRKQVRRELETLKGILEAQS
jgi:uncharacterized protein YndB with AHSA1/START domain